MDEQSQNPNLTSGATGAPIFSSSETPAPQSTSPTVVGGGSLNTISGADAPAPQPKASRRLILGIILAVLVLVGGGVATVVIINLSSNNNSTAVPVATKVGDVNITTADTYKDSFLLYANYALTGVAKTDALPEFSTETEYPIASAMENGNTEFLNIANTYLSNFTAQYQSATTVSTAGVDDENDDEVVNIPYDPYGIVAEYLEDFDTVKSFVDSGSTITSESVEAAESESLLIYNSKLAVITGIWNVWEVIK